MKRQTRSKVLALLMALLLAFQLLPMGVALAVDNDIFPNIFIHDTDGNSTDPDTDKWWGDIKSSISISAGTKDPDSGNWSNVPAGATIDFRLAFHISNLLPGEDIEAGDYFTFALPAGITIASSSAGSHALMDSLGAHIADWEITGNTLKVIFTEAAGGAVTEIQANFGFSGTFQYLEDAGSGAETTQIQFGSQTITITRKTDDYKPVNQSTLLKKAVTYDPTENTILWEVTITPPSDELNYDYRGHLLKDTLSGSHGYVDGSLKVLDGSSAEIAPITVTKAGTDNKELTLTLPAKDAGVAPITGPLTITYKTTPTGDISGTFSNSAQLWKQVSPTKQLEASNKGGDNLGMSGFFGKVPVGEIQNDSDGRPRYVQWKVTLTLPQTDNVYTYPSAKIIDELTGLTGSLAHAYYVDGTHPIQIKGPNDTSAQDVTTGMTSTGQYTIAGDKKALTYAFPNGEPKTSTTKQNNYELTYWTEITDWDAATGGNSNGALQVKNKAHFEWTPTGGPGVGTPINIGGAVVSKDVKSSGGLISKKSGGPTNFTYSAAGNFIPWTVTVNANKVKMTNPVITDTILESTGVPGTSDHKLVVDGTYKFTVTKNGESALELTGAGSNANGTLAINGDGGFSFTFPTGESTDTYTVTFYTQLTDDAIAKLYKNGDYTFKNKVQLATTSGSSAEITADKKYGLQMVDKTAVNQNGVASYDYADRTAKWSLVINRNRLPLNGDIYVIDELPEDMVLFISTNKLFTVTPNSGSPVSLELGEPNGGYKLETDASGFKLTLPSPTTDQFTITYYTQLDEDAVRESWSSAKTFTNKATLYGKNNKNGDIAPVFDTASVAVTNTVITKVSDYAATKGDTANWTVEINPGQATLTNAYVEDALPAGLEVLPGTVKLYEATVSTTSSGAKLTKTGNSILNASDLEVNEARTNFKVQLPDEAKAYILEFSTVITAENITITNTIYLKGQNETEIEHSGGTSINVDAIYSGATSNAYSLRIKKVDKDGTPMKGVQFDLLRPNNGAVFKTSAATGDDGIVTVTGLPNWYFRVREVPSTTPDGYLATAKIWGGTARPSDITETDVPHITVVNELALANVEITKEGASHVLLSGGKFTLTGNSIYNNQTFTIPNVVSVDGKVTFKNVPIGSYTITETQAPEGHVTNSTPIPVNVTYEDANKTAVKVTYGSGGTAGYTFVNEPILTDTNAKVSFTKTDEEGHPITKKDGISGGAFTLTGTTHSGTSVTMTKSVDENGLVDFGQLAVGTYKITETEAPAGYLNLTSKDIFDVLVAYKGTSHSDLEVTMTPIAPNETRYVIASKAFKNTLAAGDVKFTKKDSAGDTIKINGGTFVIEGTSLSGQAVALTGTSVDGVVTFTDVPVGDNYTIKETVPPSGYQITTKTLTGIKVEFTNAEKTAVKDVDLTADPNYILENDLIPYVPGEGKATVTKVDEDGKVLAGATFTLYDSKGAAVASMTTGADGLATFTKLKPYSSYTIKETAAPTGYELSDEVLTVTTKDRSNLTFTMVNKLLDQPTDPTDPTKPTDPTEPTDPTDPSNPTNPGGGTTEATGKLGVLKVNSDNVRLAGAEFTIYDVSGKPYASAVTGADGIVWFTNLPLGLYAVAETRAPEGYLTFEGSQGFELTAASPELTFTLRNAAEGEDVDVAGWEDDMVPLGAASGEGNLPQTGEIPMSFYLLLAGLSLLGAGFITAVPRKKSGKHLEKK